MSDELMHAGAMTTPREGKTAPPRWLVEGAAPVATALAGRRWFPLWGVVHHVGRKSGARYTVPVALVPVARDEIFLIGLPWGRRTNWAQNVLAAGGATLTWKGRDWTASNPRLVGPDEAVAVAKAPMRRLVGSGRFPAFLMLDR